MYHHFFKDSDLNASAVWIHHKAWGHLDGSCGCCCAQTFYISFPTAKLERGASALHAIPGRIQNRPNFHRSFSSSIQSNSAHRPLTTHMCEERV